LIRKLVLFGSVAALAFGAAVPSSQASDPPVDASNGTVTCETITKGVIKPKPALMNGGTTNPTLIQISGTLGGCSSPDTAVTFPEGKSKFKGLLTATNNDCAGLAGPSASTGTITISWGTVPALVNKTSTVTVSAGGSAGGFGLVAGALRGTFNLGEGAPSDGSPSSALAVSGAFTGGDGGASSGSVVVTQQAVSTILAGCADTLKGLKQINIGAGTIHLG
jgi:hypothetical protein